MFDYGDEVNVKADGVGSRIGAIVGVTRVETAEQALNFGCHLGATVYTVEFGDGSDELVTQEQLESL